MAFALCGLGPKLRGAEKVSLGGRTVIAGNAQTFLQPGLGLGVDRRNHVGLALALEGRAVRMERGQRDIARQGKRRWQRH
jgi:hypothetical protein